MLLCAQEETDSSTTVKTQIATGETRLLSIICYTVYIVYHSLGKIWRESFRWTPGTMKIKHTNIFLPQRNRAVYNGLWPAKTKVFYHRFFLMNIFNH